MDDEAEAATPADGTTSPARALLAEVVGDAGFAALPDAYPLARSGVNSGDLVRLMLALEDRLDRPLTLEEVHRLATIADIDELLRTQAAAPDSAPSA